MCSVTEEIPVREDVKFRNYMQGKICEIHVVSMKRVEVMLCMSYFNANSRRNLDGKSHENRSVILIKGL